MASYQCGLARPTSTRTSDGAYDVVACALCTDMAPPKLPRHQGRVIAWDDAKGFGWIRPSDLRDADIWFHADQFLEERSPRINDAVSFAIGTGKNGRENAISVILDTE
jgi:cold shock CspA family protein